MKQVEGRKEGNRQNTEKCKKVKKKTEDIEKMERIKGNICYWK